MKVAQFIGSCGPGGAEAIALNLARELSVVGNMECVVYVTNVRDEAWTQTQLLGGDVEVIVLPEELMQYWKVTSMITFSKMFAELLKKDGVTHLHSHMYPQILRGALAAWFADIPHVGTLHDVVTIEEKPSLIRWLKVATMLGTKLVAVSHHMTRAYHKVSEDFFCCTLPHDNPTVIYNGVDTDIYYPRECDKPFPDGFNLISVGRIADVKNYSMLIEAMRILVNQYGHDDIHLTIIGDGPERDMLEGHCNNFLPDNVQFLGSRDDVPELLCGGDLFVLTSNSEGLSCSILEAMASGLPVLATDVGGNRELVTKDNGALAQPGDAHAFAAMVRAIMLQGDAEYMGENSLQRVQEDFSFNNMVDSYLHMYVDG